MVFDFGGIQVVLGDCYILLADHLTTERGQAHVGLLDIGSGFDDLSGSLAGHGVRELVLNGGEEKLRFIGAHQVVDTQSANLTNPLVKELLRTADVPNPLQKFVEVVSNRRLLFQLLVVERKSLNDVITKALGCPDSELGADVRPNPIADRDDDIEVVVSDAPLHLSPSFNLNCQVFLDS
jgi:hypothetical protein